MKDWSGNKVSTYKCLGASNHTYHIQVEHTIFWWNETKERAEELVRYYEGLYPDKEIQMIKNKEKL